MENNKINLDPYIIKLIENRKYNDAEQKLLEIIKKDEKNSDAYYLLGNVYALLNKCEKAIHYYKISLKFNQKNKIAQYNLGTMLDQLGQLDESQNAFKEALKLDANYINANLAMAISCEKQNKIDEAKAFFEKTLSINKDFALGNQLYGRFLTKIGEINKGQYYEYKYSGVIRFKEKINTLSNIERIDLSKDKNFIGCWDIKENELCKNIIDLFENRKDLQKIGEIGTGKNEKAKKSIDISLNPRSLLNKEFKPLKVYIDKLQVCYQDYKIQWPFLKDHIKILDIPAFNIQKYEKGGHFNMIHCERSNTQSMHRVFAWMTYLNDVEDGGETYFEHFDLRIKPKAGKTLIWPAEWTHAHRGEILNKGNKYIITGWMHFPFNVKL